MCFLLEQLLLDFARLGRPTQSIAVLFRTHIKYEMSFVHLEVIFRKIPKLKISQPGRGVTSRHRGRVLIPDIQELYIILLLLL